jgi:acetyl-CoA decarbonylase/synthase complex subunit gamma
MKMLSSINVKFKTLSQPRTLGRIDKPWASGTISTEIGKVPRVSTSRLFMDKLDSFKARWGIGRMSYNVAPGLYAVGNPSAESPVLLSANYKMSFDSLRSELGGLDAWILVLDTKGINVWCAAGKGTFGTCEILRSIEVTGLDKIVSHRTLITPQLGAPGISAHEVKRKSGFRVVYGPVRASDVKEFLSTGMKATPEMRKVRFDFSDRIVLIPMEIVLWLKIVIPVTAGFLLLSGLGPDGFSFERVKVMGTFNVALFLSAFLGGAILGPALLPWLPGRAFSVKGAWVGLLLVTVSGIYIWSHPEVISSRLSALSWVLIIPAVSSFVVMNFTGASTYTSLGGVRKEMRYSVPVQIAGAVLGVSLWAGGLFV